MTSDPHFSPQLQTSLTKEELSTQSSPFPQISEEENKLDWAKEYKIGSAFAKKGDFYRAITSFERAAILGEGTVGYTKEREQEIYYQIFRCYFLAGKYQEALDTFTSTHLNLVSHKNFPAFRDLLILLQEAYVQTGQEEQAQNILKIMEQCDQETSEKMSMKTAWQQGNLSTINLLSQKNPEWDYFRDITQSFENEKKSVRKAQIYNALLPGAGYYYVEQKQTALTAFLLNGCFIAAAVQAFDAGFPFLGAIITSFELGWYIGGINGAGIAANEYNEHLYEQYGKKALKQEKLYPLFLLDWSF